MKSIDRLVRVFGWFLRRPAIRKIIQRQILEVVYLDPIIIGPPERLHMEPNAFSNNFLANTNSGDIHIGNYVFFGKNVNLITGSHNYRKFGPERIADFPKEGNNIVIEEGAWIGTNATILGPCVVGKHAVVGAGSVVTEDVPPFAIVAGVPAKVVKTIEHEDVL